MFQKVVKMLSDLVKAFVKCIVRTSETDTGTQRQLSLLFCIVSNMT